MKPKDTAAGQDLTKLIRNVPPQTSTHPGDSHVLSASGSNHDLSAIGRSGHIGHFGTELPGGKNAIRFARLKIEGTI